MIQGASRETFAVIHVAEIIRGGIATYLREIIALQVKRYGANRIAVIAPKAQLADLGELPGVMLLGIDHARSRLWTAWRVRQRLVRLIAERPTHVLHIHSAFAGLACRIRPLGRDRFQRMIYCPHGWAFTRVAQSAGLAARIERVLSKQCDAIVCVSGAEKEAALSQGFKKHKLTKIYNGLPDRSVPEPEDCESMEWPLRLLFSGRLDRQKGFDVLLAALECSDRDIEVHVFGESVLGEYSVQNLPGVIHMHGWQSFEAIESYLSNCDAVVMPSRWEGLPLSALEAMRAGKPTIASAVGGLVELIEDGVTGYLVVPDDVEALANVIESVKRTQLVAMGQRARHRFLERFSIEQCESELADLYEAVLARSVDDPFTFSMHHRRS